MQLLSCFFLHTSQFQEQVLRELPELVIWGYAFCECCVWVVACLGRSLAVWPNCRSLTVSSAAQFCPPTPFYSTFYCLPRNFTTFSIFKAFSICEIDIKASRMNILCRSARNVDESTIHGEWKIQKVSFYVNFGVPEPPTIEPAGDCSVSVSSRPAQHRIPLGLPSRQQVDVFIYQFW